MRRELWITFTLAAFLLTIGMLFAACASASTQSEPSEQPTNEGVETYQYDDGSTVKQLHIPYSRDYFFEVYTSSSHCVYVSTDKGVDIHCELGAQ